MEARIVLLELQKYHGGYLVEFSIFKNVGRDTSNVQ